MRYMQSKLCWALAVTVLVLSQAAMHAGEKEPAQAQAPEIDAQVTQGALRVQQPDGSILECPLKHTDVQATISGFLARVRVTQTFYNPLQEKIEAVYVFPLPHEAAVDGMTMVIGERRIVGRVERRAAARQIYEQALAQGQTAALLEQERPNIFTQSVGNIGPQQEVRVEITYVDVLAYDMGVYEFHFPMVVGPRFIPGTPTSTPPPLSPELQGKTSAQAPDTDRVPDASRITPPVLKPGMRNGHDIALRVALNAGVPVQDLTVVNHKAAVEQAGATLATVQMDPADSIPNKDFILKYKVVGTKPEMAVLTNTDESGIGYFLMMIQPREDERLAQSPPREICFLIDVSGSMSGAPTEQVKRTMREMLKLCKEQDTVQVMTFASQAFKLFPQAVPVTEENIGKAVNFTQSIRGGGGTQMLEGVKLAINDPIDQQRVRIVVMLTDGYIGNEAEIIKEVGTRCGDQIRFWVLGIGNSVNHFLVDGVAKQGGGMGKILTLNEDMGPVAQEIMYRIHRAQLAKIQIDFGSVPVYDTLPARIPELWAGRPVILYGCYEQGQETTVTVRGSAEGQPEEWTLPAAFPARNLENEVLRKVWARRKIEDLMQQTYYAGSPAVEEEVTRMALSFQLMSQYTSFVAVDATRAPDRQALPPRRMCVPVPLPEGTVWEGFFGGAGGGEGEEADGAFLVEKKASLKRMGKFDKRASAGGWAQGMNRAEENARTVSAGGAVYREMTAAAPGLPMAPPVRSRAALATLQGGEGGRGKAADAIAALPLTDRGDVELGKGAGSAPAKGAFDVQYTAHAMRGQSASLRERLQTVMKDAAELRAKGALEEASARFAFAYLLDAACMNVQASRGEAGAEALAAMRAMAKDLRAQWSRAVPGLDNPVDLILRDQSIAEALAAVGRAAGFPITLLDGSVEDAARVLRRRDVRVDYLDLRHVPAAQALDWILQPVRMAWRVDKGAVVAGSVRRQAIPSAWVYDVSRIALPAMSELSQDDWQAHVKLAQAQADRFLDATRKTLGQGEVVWFAPGEVLVFGETAAHTAASALLQALADPAAAVAEDLKDLHAVTQVRAAARSEDFARLEALRERTRVTDMLSESSWALLAAAARGEADLEALTVLQIAWKAPDVDALLSGERAAVALRSLWAISEAARVDLSLREDFRSYAPKFREELDALQQAARHKCQAVAEAALASLQAKPEDASAFTQVLYAALALREDAAYVTKAAPLLTGGRDANSRLASAQVLSSALLSAKGVVDEAALLGLLQAGLQGDDMVALTALACRRAGGDAWKVFRAEARDILGEQPLSGSVIVFVNRLAHTQLALAMAKP